MKNLMKERNDLKEELESIDKQMELLKTRKEIATKTLENLKLRFKKECLRDSGGHDTHYWLRMSIETPIGKFSQEQWDNVAVDWPKTLLEYIAKNEELFCYEDLRFFVTSKGKEYISEYRKLIDAQNKLKEL